VTAHKVRRKRLARGAALIGKNGAGLVRITVSLPPEHFRRLAWMAKKRGHPVAAIIRAGVLIWLQLAEADEAG
jgi:hypothetical protein